MPYANKLQECSNARRILGVDKFATKNEVRAAWRERAIEFHPDRPKGSVEAFQAVNEAYELLIGEAPDTRWSPPCKATYSGETPESSPALDRARIFTKTVEVSPILSQLCQTALSDGEIAKLTAPKAEDDGYPMSEPGSTDHIPSSVRRKGRRLSYIVNSFLKTGENRVALPTGAATGRRNEKAEIVALKALSDGRATVEIPDRVRKEKFPGAEQVRIHFGKQ